MNGFVISGIDTVFPNQNTNMKIQTAVGGVEMIGDGPMCFYNIKGKPEVFIVSPSRVENFKKTFRPNYEFYHASLRDGYWQLTCRFKS